MYDEMQYLIRLYALIQLIGLPKKKSAQKIHKELTSL